MFGFTGTFMMILSCMWTLSNFIHHASSPWPPLSPFTIPKQYKKQTKKKKQQEQVTKKFWNENKGWNPKKPTKLDANDTTTVSYSQSLLLISACTHTVHNYAFRICTCVFGYWSNHISNLLFPSVDSPTLGSWQWPLGDSNSACGKRSWYQCQRQRWSMWMSLHITMY